MKTPCAEPVGATQRVLPRLAALLRRRRGAAAAELAMVAPVLGLISLGTADLVQFQRSQLRLEAAVVQVGQAVSQCRQLSNPGDIGQLWQIAQQAVGGVSNLASPSGGAVIVTAVRRTSGANQVAWQMRTGNMSFTSRVGNATAGSAATIPAGFVVPNGQVLLVTEVFTPAMPWPLSRVLMSTGVLPSTLGATTMYLSRAPDPTPLLSAPTTNATPVCMT